MYGELFVESKQYVSSHDQVRKAEEIQEVPEDLKDSDNNTGSKLAENKDMLKDEIKQRTQKMFRMTSLNKNTMALMASKRS